MDTLKITNVFIDWMTAVGQQTGITTWVGRYLNGDDRQPIRPSFHQQRGYKYTPSEVKLYFSPDHADTGSVLVYDGEACSQLRNRYGEVDAISVARVLARSCTHFSRIDLAIDVMDGGLLAQKVAGYTYRHGLNWGRRKATVIKSDGAAGGCTTYVGSRHSPKLMRVYDKAAESKGKLLSSRIEFELKHEAAQRVSELFKPLDAYLLPSRLFTALLHDFWTEPTFPEIEQVWWAEVQTIDVHRKARMSTTKEWLARQVIPSFRRLSSDDLAELLFWFNEQVIK